MLDKLEQIYIRYKDLEQKLSDPSSTSDMDKFKSLNKDYRSLEPIKNAYLEYKDTLSNIEVNRDIMKNEKDADLKEMAKMELDELEPRKEKLEEDIRFMLIPKDPADEKNVMLEIRAGTGGDEACIFASDLLRMYLRYCETKGWKTEILDENEGATEGYREVVVSVKGENVYGDMKYESGVHRVQRIPKTESQGRVHTSAATVAVLPEAEEFDFYDEEFFGQIADLGERYSKNTELRNMNGNRGSKHFLYINRTFFGLYNLLHDIKARVDTRHFEKYLR